MKAAVWHGKRDVRVDTVPDPTIQEPTDAIVRVTSSGLCGSDLHLYEVLGPFMTTGDILGHEPMGIVEAVGSAVTNIAPGDRVVVPFNISCGHCYMCAPGPAVAVRDDAGARVRHRRGAVRLHQALRPGARRAGRAACASRRRSTARSRCPTARPTIASCTCPTCCRPRGRPCSTPTIPPRRHRRGPRARPHRRHVRAASPATSAPPK